jgi:YidC/Oxa1 family membrane protein insertase
MGNLRPVLIVGLVFLGYMIWVQWQKDYGPAPQAPAPQTQVQSDTPTVPSAPEDHSVSAADLPQPLDRQQDQPSGSRDTPTADASNENSLVRVKTDVLDVEIDLIGGTMV